MTAPLWLLQSHICFVFFKNPISLCGYCHYHPWQCPAHQLERGMKGKTFSLTLTQLCKKRNKCHSSLHFVLFFTRLCCASTLCKIQSLQYINNNHSDSNNKRLMNIMVFFYDWHASICWWLTDLHNNIHVQQNKSASNDHIKMGSSF